VEHRLPEIAAQHTQASLAVLAERSPVAHGRVRARLRPEVREALDGATRLDFLPAQVDLDVALAIHAEVGPDGARRVAREVLRRSLAGPVLGSLVTSASALFGLTPPDLLRWASRGWSRVCRDCGELQVVGVADEVVHLALTGMPELLEHPSYLSSIGGALEAFLDICRVEGEVEVEPRPGGAHFELRWRGRERRTERR
jgi:hypothetical protein